MFLSLTDFFNFHKEQKSFKGCLQKGEREEEKEEESNVEEAEAEGRVRLRLVTKRKFV